MIIAVLFNSDDPKFDGYYGGPIRDIIFKTSVLQSSKRHMKVKLGDVNIYRHAKTPENYKRLAEATFFSDAWSLAKRDRIEATYAHATICAWVIQNVTHKIAEQLDAALSSESAYLGLHAIEFIRREHLMLYRNSMGDYCRITGDRCMLAYSMGNEESRNLWEAEHLQTLGFSEVGWEDRGAHGTIFDKYDTLEHFEQVREVQSIFSTCFKEGDYEAEEIIMMLEDSNPRLFDTLGAAVRAVNRAQNAEEIAQVGLSGRRYIEQLADVLFAPSDIKEDGRSVTKAKFKNRIWAFIKKFTPLSETNRDNEIQCLGKEVDRLIDEVNALVHGDQDKTRALRILFDLAKLTASLLQLNPAATRNPYDAFNQSMLDFIEKSRFDSESNTPFNFNNL